MAESTAFDMPWEILEWIHLENIDVRQQVLCREANTDAMFRFPL